jgi:hypothetical protein
MKITLNTIRWTMAIMGAIILFIFSLGCNKVDNSELCQRQVWFINPFDILAEVHLKETGGVFEVKAHDSINFPESAGKPTLTMTYKAYIYPNSHQEFICERNVTERNLIR